VIFLRPAGSPLRWFLAAGSPAAVVIPAGPCSYSLGWMRDRCRAAPAGWPPGRPALPRGVRTRALRRGDRPGREGIKSDPGPDAARSSRCSQRTGQPADSIMYIMSIQAFWPAPALRARFNPDHYVTALPSYDRTRCVRAAKLIVSAPHGCYPSTGCRHRARSGCARCSPQEAWPAVRPRLYCLPPP
jgi:hypothetical protein